MTTTLVFAAAVAAAYWAGRVRLGHRLDRWAERQVGGPHGPGWWAAQVVMAAEAVWLFAAHPRRTVTRLREAREFERVPAPRFDTDWAAKRGATTPPKETS